MRTVTEAEPEETALWLETFTAKQEGLLYISLNIAAKEHCKIFSVQLRDYAT